MTKVSLPLSLRDESRKKESGVSSLVPFHALTRCASSLTSLQSESLESARGAPAFLRLAPKWRVAPLHNNCRDPCLLVNNADIEQLRFSHPQVFSRLCLKRRWLVMLQCYDMELNL